MDFKLKSILKPPESVGVSIATAALVFGVYQYSLPGLTEVHGAMPHNNNVASSQKKAMWESATIVSGAFLLTKDSNVFMAGTLAFLFLEWSYRHANAVHPETGMLVPQTGSQALESGYAMDSGSGDYGDAGAGDYSG
jgi:hypothetical protein